MQITSTRAFQPAVQAPPSQTSTPAAQVQPGPQESFTFSQSEEGSKGIAAAKAVAGLAVGAGIGVLAGLNTGVLAGFGGAAVLALPGAFAGGIAGALVAEQKSGEASEIVGAGLLGAIVGGVAGAGGGAAVASQFGGIGAAVTLGVVGGATGLLTNLN